MKKLLAIVVLGLLTACATTEKIVSSGKIKVDMSKGDLSDVFLISYPDDDPLLDGGSEFHFFEGHEIIWGKNKKQYFVFKNVSNPKTCGVLFCKKGNGTLKSWHATLNEARTSINKKIADKKSTNEKERREALAKRWHDPGYTDAGFPQPESFWIFIKSPPNPADLYAYMACQIAKKEYKLKGFTITVWDFNKKKYGKARCY